MQRILLTGASGFLGANFCRLYARQFEIHALYHHHKINFKDIRCHKTDITKPKAFEKLFHEIKPDIVLHLAAFSNPNLCESTPAVSEAINIEASENIAGLCAEARIPMVFASTDLVFDGKHAPYVERDVPAPVNVYGLHKSIAEQTVLDICPNATVCRLPLMYGNAFTENGSFIQPFIKKLAAGEALNLFTDEYRSVASARDVCNGIVLCFDKPGEIFHLGGDERISRYKFGQKLCKVFGYDKSLIIKSKQKDVPMPAPRPKDVSLKNNKMKDLGWEPGRIEDELAWIKKTEM